MKNDSSAERLPNAIISITYQPTAATIFKRMVFHKVPFRLQAASRVRQERNCRQKYLRVIVHQRLFLVLRVKADLWLNIEIHSE